MPHLPSHAQIVTQLTELRPFVGLLGVILAFSGARVYRVAVVLPGVVAGIVLASQVPGSPEARLVAAVALGLIGGIVLFLVERLAIALAGALLLGGLANAATPLLLHQPTPWYVPLAASLAGLMLFPKLYRAFLPAITALLGGLCVAWAVDEAQDLRIIGGVAAVGLLVQLVFRRKRRGDD